MIFSNKILEFQLFDFIDGWEVLQWLLIASNLFLGTLSKICLSISNRSLNLLWVQHRADKRVQYGTQVISISPYGLVSWNELFSHAWVIIIGARYEGWATYLTLGFGLVGADRMNVILHKWCNYYESHIKSWAT